jgi:hypothetical protein
MEVMKVMKIAATKMPAIPCPRTVANKGLSASSRHRSEMATTTTTTTTTRCSHDYLGAECHCDKTTYDDYKFRIHRFVRVPIITHLKAAKVALISITLGLRQTSKRKSLPWRDYGKSKQARQL